MAEKILGNVMSHAIHQTLHYIDKTLLKWIYQTFPPLSCFSISVICIISIEMCVGARMRMCVMHMFVLVLFQYPFIKIYFEK